MACGAWGADTTSSGNEINTFPIGSESHDSLLADKDHH